jgi:hypothetical protein
MVGDLNQLIKDLNTGKNGSARKEAENYVSSHSAGKRDRSAEALKCRRDSAE